MSTELAAIPFPNLDPVLFELGPVAIRWYGLAYVLGFVAAYLLLRRLARRENSGIVAATIGDLVSWGALGVVLGGRAGWWLFYHQGVVEHWYEPFAIWQGGMSFHGGVIGVAISVALWAWKSKTHVWAYLDAVALVTPVGLFFGRIANFINAELVGRETNVPWAVIFPGHLTPRHPSQLYEALLEGPVLLGILWLSRQRLHLRQGELTALFLMAYSVIRFAVEFTREPDSELGFIAFNWLTTGQLLSVLMLTAGLLTLVSRRARTNTTEHIAPHLPLRS